MQKPYSPSCERNQEPILEVLKRLISKDGKSLLEIGSGTGQHASYFCQQFPNLTWLTSDRPENHPGIIEWKTESNVENFLGPVDFEIGVHPFPEGNYDYIFTANTFHIMPWKTDKTLIKMLGKTMKTHSLFIIYGPFNYFGKPTSPSNQAFDTQLRQRNPQSGIRNFEDVTNAMVKNGFFLLEDIEMPANNRVLIFEKS